MSGSCNPPILINQHIELSNISKLNLILERWICSWIISWKFSKILILELSVINGTTGIDAVPEATKSHLEWLEMYKPAFRRSGKQKDIASTSARSSEQQRRDESKRSRWITPEKRKLGWLWDEEKCLPYKKCSKKTCNGRLYKLAGKTLCANCRVSQNITLFIGFHFFSVPGN